MCGCRLRKADPHIIFAVRLRGGFVFVTGIMNATVPALLFPAISLLFLAYTNRFLALTSLARGILKEHGESPQPHWEAQLVNIRKRLRLIRQMQLFGLGSILLAALSMGLMFFGDLWGVGSWHLGELVLGVSLVCFILSLALCVHEIKLSIDAIEVEFRRCHVPDVK